MNLLTVNQTTENRIFSTGTGAITILLQDITFNYSGPAVAPYSGGGGAIIAGGAGAASTFINCRFTNFQRQIGNGGAISQSSSLNSHNLTITNCIFTNNRAGGAGGAVSFNSQGGTATITGCTFDNNHTGTVGANTGGDGGAISVTGGGDGGTYLIEKNTFLNNQVENVTGHAGAVMNTNGTLTLRYNRFIGNTCANVAFPPLANVVGQAGGATIHVTIADNNWWGVNTGPGTNDATALAAGAVMTLTNWLQLKATAAPTPICPTNVLLGNTSTVTASFLTNSAGNPVTVANLARLIGLPISFSAILGNLSGAQASIQAAGTATVLFTSNGTPGNGSVNAVVDNVPSNDATARANIVINAPASISIPPGNTIVCVGSTATFSVTATGTAPITYVWRRGTTVLNNGATGTGSTISNATTSTISISNVSAADIAANYNVLVSNSCAANVGSGNASLNVLPPPVVSAPTITQPTCAVPTGTIVVNATGDGTLEYRLNAGAWQTSNSFPGLSANNYNIAVRLQSLPACATSYSGNPVVINAVPALPVVNVPTVTQPNCTVPSGTIVVNATGSGTLEYQLNAGGWQVSNSFPSLASGNYSISVRLQSQPTCVTNYSGNPVVINPVPVPPVINAPTVTQPTCVTLTGTIVVNATGSGTLEYRLNSGSWQTSSSFPSLVPGNYNISVRLQSFPDCSSAYASNPVVLVASTTCCSLAGSCNLNPAEQVIEGCDITSLPAAFTNPADVFTNISTPCGALVLSYADVATGTICPNGITVVRTYTLFDDLNNNQTLDAGEQSMQCVQNFKILDRTPPSITAPADVTLQCNDPLPLNPLNVNSSPNNMPGTYMIGTAVFGPPLTATPVTGNLVLVNDGVGNTADACEPIINDLTGKIAVIDRNICTFIAKVLNAQNKGAIAVIIINNTPGDLPLGLGGTDPSITIPAISVSNNYGNALKASMALGTVNVSISASTLVITDNCGIVSLTSYTELKTPGTCQGSYSLLKTWTAADACGNSTSASQTITVPCCVTNCTYTQGFYGNASGTACDGTTSYSSTRALLDVLLGINPGPANSLTVGRNGWSVIVPGTIAGRDKLITVMPGGGQAKALTVNNNVDITSATFTSNYLKKNKIDNVLLGQTIALSLNLRMPGSTLGLFQLQNGWLVTQKKSGCGPGAAIVSCASNSGAIQSFQMNDSVVRYLTRAGTVVATVSDLLNLANDVLGKVKIPGTVEYDLGLGTAFTVPSFANINNQVDAINKGFDNCRQFRGYFNCEVNCTNIDSQDPCTPPSSFSKAEKVDIISDFNEVTNLEVTAHPNPFSSSTTLRYILPEDVRVNLSVYNKMGYQVAQLVDGQEAKGSHQVRFDASKLSAGVYLFRLQTRDLNGKTKVLTGKMLFIK